jgi:hypothetical protein
MARSKEKVENCIRRAKQGKHVGKKHQPSKSSGGIKKSRSFLSMDNLDVPEGEEDDDSFDKAELNDSSDRELAEKDLHTA